MRGAVLGLRGDRPVIQTAGGIANASTGALCTLETRFQIASVSKQFTAAAILLLEERGALSLADPAGRWIEGCPQTWNDITLHHLLTHTSGLVHWKDLPELDLTRRLDAREEIAVFQRTPLHSAPGAAWYYSSPGYVLLAHVVESSSGRPYREFLADEIFKPLEMASTFAGNGSGGRLAAGFAHGEPVPSFELDVVNMGTGDVWSTVGDIARWDLGLAANRLFSERSTQSMLTSHALVEDPNFAPAIGYGYAWFAGDIGGRRALYHPGDNAGFQSLNAWLVDDDVRIIVLSNDEETDIHLLVAEIFAVIFSG